MNFTITTERLTIQPFSNIFLKTYYKEFTDKITQYQYPDSFPSIASADKILSKFVHDMTQGEMLELVILTHDGEFIQAWKLLPSLKRHPSLDSG